MQPMMLVVLELCVAIQSWVNNVYSRGLSTHPWTAPMLSIIVDEVTLPIRTTCHLPFWKSRIQFHKEAVMRRSRNLTSLDGIMVLKPEL